MTMCHHSHYHHDHHCHDHCHYACRRATVSSVCAHLAHNTRKGERPAARAAAFVGRGTRAEAVGAGAAGMAQAYTYGMHSESRWFQHGGMPAEDLQPR